jgi:hypothetical protein
MDENVVFDLVDKVTGAARDRDRQNALIEELCGLRHADTTEASTLRVRVRALADRKAPALDYLVLLGVEDPLGRL